MKTIPSVNKVPFNKLIECFIQRTEQLYTLNYPFGKGHAHILNLEKGLQVRFWNFCLLKEVELYNDLNCNTGNAYYTLAFFLSTKGLRFSDTTRYLKENKIWNAIFLSNVSNYKMHMAPMALGQCISISFSKKWLETVVFKNNDSLKGLKSRMNGTASFSLYESMSEGDRRQLTELMNTTWKDSLGTFSIQSSVLKIISNFFNRVKDRGDFNFEHGSVETCITEVETYLQKNITCSLPDLKSLAQSFSVSERTLARHFKKRHGVNASTYFLGKKLAYAKHLMTYENMNIHETANLIGYKNIYNLKAMLKKHAE